MHLNIQEVFYANLSFDNFENPAFLNNDFIVDWNNFNIHQKDSITYFEFDVIYQPNSSFDFENYAAKKHYSLIASMRGAQPEYLLTESLPFKHSQAKKPNYFNTDAFSGMQYIYSITGELLSITRFEQGEIAEHFLEETNTTPLQRPSPCVNYTKSLSQKSITSKCDGSQCGTRTIRTNHYLAWYEVETNNLTGEIVSIRSLYTEYVGTTVQLVYSCSSGGQSSSSNSEGKFIIPQVPEGIDPEEFLELLEELDEQIFIDQSFENNPCLKSVYDNMGKATAFNKYLKKFDSKMSVANLIFTTNDNFREEDVKYHNAMAITSPPLSSNGIVITFNTDANTSGNILDKPDVFKAVAMIHEVIHAEMYRKMLDAMIVSEGIGTTLDWTNFTKEEFDNYLNTLQNKYFGIWDYYTRYDNNDATPDNGQHQQMAQHYRNIIKQALTDYDPTLTNSQKEALSWIGLNEANIRAWQNLTQDERDIIDHTIIQIKNTFSNECN